MKNEIKLYVLRWNNLKDKWLGGKAAYRTGRVLSFVGKTHEYHKDTWYLDRKFIGHQRNLTMIASGEKSGEKGGKMSFHYVPSCNTCKFCSHHAPFCYLIKKLTKKKKCLWEWIFFFSPSLLFYFTLHAFMLWKYKVTAYHILLFLLW